MSASIVSPTNFDAIDITRGTMEFTETILSMVNAASEPGQPEALTKKDAWRKEQTGNVIWFICMLQFLLLFSKERNN